MDDRPRRIRWLAPLGLAAVFALGWAVGPASAYLPGKPVPSLPSPVFADSDGLPQTLVAGQEYTAQFTVSFPADWPITENRGRLAAIVMYAYSEKHPAHEAVLFCSDGQENVAGRTVTTSCPFIAPELHGYWDIHVVADDGASIFGAFIHNPARVDDTEHVYGHTLAPKPD